MPSSPRTPRSHPNFAAGAHSISTPTRKRSPHTRAHAQNIHQLAHTRIRPAPHHVSTNARRRCRYAASPTLPAVQFSSRMHSATRKAHACLIKRTERKPHLASASNYSLPLSVACVHTTHAHTHKHINPHLATATLSTTTTTTTNDIIGGAHRTPRTHNMPYVYNCIRSWVLKQTIS